MFVGWSKVFLKVPQYNYHTLTPKEITVNQCMSEFANVFDSNTWDNYHRENRCDRKCRKVTICETADIIKCVLISFSQRILSKLCCKAPKHTKFKLNVQNTENTKFNAIHSRHFGRKSTIRNHKFFRNAIRRRNRAYHWYISSIREKQSNQIAGYVEIDKI